MLLTVNDLAARWQIKPSTLYAWAARGKVPSLKINGVVRFDSDAIAHWLESCHVRVGIPPKMPQPNGGNTEIDRLVERAKREVYSTPHGETRPDRAPRRKEVRHGAQ